MLTISCAGRLVDGKGLEPPENSSADLPPPDSVPSRKNAPTLWDSSQKAGKRGGKSARLFHGREVRSDRRAISARTMA